MLHPHSFGILGCNLAVEYAFESSSLIVFVQKISKELQLLLESYEDSKFDKKWPTVPVAMEWVKTFQTL